MFALFTDLSKAFDNVDHFKLGWILLDGGIPEDIVQILMIYLGNQLVRINWNDQKDDYKVLNSGVRKGGIISPFLFKLYVENILSDLNNNNCGCFFGLTRIAVVAYTDDIVLLADSHNDLNDILVDS